MWTIKQIFDGDYGCEERAPGAGPKVSVTLENEAGEIKYITADDNWLRQESLEEGSIWPEE